jgi:hypothetical protein
MMSMWRNAILALAVSASAAVAEDSAQVCVVRPENTGTLNTMLTRVVVADAGTIFLGGGDSACMKVTPGDVTVSAESSSLDQPGATWSSNTLALSIPAGRITALYLCPRRNATAYCCGWQLAESPCSP